MLSVSGLVTGYGRAQILEEISLSVGPDEVVSLMGRNGAGKSTTLKAIMGLLPPWSGSVMFQGQQVAGVPSYRIARAGIGYVPEDRRIFPDLTVLENLAVGTRAGLEGAPQWHQTDLFELFPNLAERRTNLGKQLSGGEQQMLSIARTLMGNPRLLLLDEPSEGIAPVIVDQMAKAIKAMKRQGLAILLSEQNLSFARRVSDRVVVIEKGHKVFEGPFTDLDADPQIMKAHLAL